MERAEIPGMAIGIISGGELIHVAGYGYADVEQGIPAEDSTIFMIASISKTVTATAMMVLESRGEIDLDDDINEYLPFRIVNPHVPDGTITFRTLLTHTSGIIDNWNVYDPLYTIDSGGGDSPVTLDRLMRGYFLPGGEYFDPDANFSTSPPGTQYEYSNIGYSLVGYLVQEISGTDFRELRGTTTSSRTDSSTARPRIYRLIPAAIPGW
jgi:CubicO group peptidase (beta-lactamase class C family)